MFFRAPAGAVIILIVSLSFCAFSHANNSELESRLSESALVITEMMEAPDASIPQDLLKSSKAIVIFPSVIKVGLGFGGQYGKGVALRKNNSSSNWGPPVFF
ncbi:MAG: lipid-binding SYLF domain-containing protein, partial [Syntrophaceae bacterium]|nr:lipid-binding SYLF domain-containing protein [Syntrophaceae bacterium]